MARSRNIKPGFFKNEDLGTADPFVSLLFAGLWTLADRSGILEDRPLRIKGELFPYRENFDINGYLTVLVRFGLIRRYQVGNGKYIQVVEFKKHQNPHHTEKESEYPEYSDGCVLTVIAPLNTRDTPADSLIPDSLIPDSVQPDPPNQIPLPSAAEKSAAPKKVKVAGSGETWKAYSDAYLMRYEIAPVRNATISSQIVQFVRRLGESESPLVAAFFLTHNDQFYVKQMHSVGAMLKDAEKLRTEWATGKKTEVVSFKTAAERREENSLRAVDEFLGNSVIEGEFRHA